MEVNSKKLLFCINSRERHKDASIEVLCFLVTLENYYLYNAEAVVIIALFVGFHEVQGTTYYTVSPLSYTGQRGHLFRSWSFFKNSVSSSSFTFEQQPHEKHRMAAARRR
jgi:hypothetical protein